MKCFWFRTGKYRKCHGIPVRGNDFLTPVKRQVTDVSCFLAGCPEYDFFRLSRRQVYAEACGEKGVHIEAMGHAETVFSGFHLRYPVHPVDPQLLSFNAECHDVPSAQIFFHGVWPQCVF